MTRPLRAIVLFVAFVTFVSFAGELVRAQESPARLVIGSKNFTESHILGEMMALLVEAHTGIEVEHRSGLGGTLVCFTATARGEIDLYPEYTGTAWSIILKESGRVDDPLRAFLHVQSRFRDRYDLEWLAPFGLNNSYALAMREEQAAALGVREISDLIPHAGTLDAGFSIEFMNREDGWPGLRPFYGLDFRQVRAMEHGLAYEAIAGGVIDLIDAYTTDGKLLRYPLRVLEDDRGFFPPYNAAPVIRGEVLRAHPELRELLERLSFRIPDRVMIELNHAVEERGRAFREVARGFLVAEGLIDAGEALEGDPDAGRDSLLAFMVGRWDETLRLGWRHVQLSLAAVLLAVLVAVPLGIAVARRRVAERVALGAAGVVQTIPSLALLAFMIAIPGLGLSVRSAIVALFLYAVLPILRNTHTGLRSISPELLDAAVGIGLTPRQILFRVQLPLATRTIMAGVRTATVISIGVATLAAFIGAGGLGEPIVTGLYLNDTRLILSGAIPAAVLAILADALLGRLEVWLTPRGVHAGV
ncbi:MAG TPA: glycine betaine ABC transporter substrate-binding protein [Thermoanaerobaculia bacterium]|nr:glycine betaine ABC transporter substrate-binding protein [Thermoanaerobaculia bacterium]